MKRRLALLVTLLLPLSSAGDTPQNLRGIVVCAAQTYGFSNEVLTYYPNRGALQSRIAGSITTALRTARIPTTPPESDGRCPTRAGVARLYVRLSLTPTPNETGRTRTFTMELSARVYDPTYPQGITLWSNKLIGGDRTSAGFDVRMRDAGNSLAQSFVSAWRAGNTPQPESKP